MTADSYDRLLEIVRDRRSIRRFRPDPVPDALIDDILEAARWAPSAGNRQPFRFFVVSDAERRQQLALRVKAVAAKLEARVRPDLKESFGTYLTNFAHFAEAPTLITAIYRTDRSLLEAILDEMDGVAEADEVMEMARVSGVASASAAIMALLLAVHARGLGACWMTGPLIAAKSIHDYLDVPRSWQIAALIPVGYPADDAPPEPPPRRPLARLVRRL